MFYYAKIDVTGLEVFMLMREMHLKNVVCHYWYFLDKGFSKCIVKHPSTALTPRATTNRHIQKRVIINEKDTKTTICTKSMLFEI